MTTSTEPLTLREVRKRTGLTARALRFYETRGLVRPVRTYSGARLYGPAELERLHKVLVLRRAGLTLEQIGRVLEGRPPELLAIVDTQIEVLKAEGVRIAEAIASLEAASGHLRSGRDVDVVTLCNIIRTGDTAMENEAWKKVADRFYSPEEQAHWAERMSAAPAGFDQAAYQKQWQELSARIEAALPLDPASAQAQALLDDWTKLLQPFTAVATPEMMQGASRLYSRMDEWSGKDGMPQSPFPAQVWQFIQAASTARKQKSG